VQDVLRSKLTSRRDRVRCMSFFVKIASFPFCIAFPDPCNEPLLLRTTIFISDSCPTNDRLARKPGGQLVISMWSLVIDDLPLLCL
jgi:hypothetical protein